jgi:integrase
LHTCVKACNLNRGSANGVDKTHVKEYSSINNESNTILIELLSLWLYCSFLKNFNLNVTYVIDLLRSMYYNGLKYNVKELQSMKLVQPIRYRENLEEMKIELLKKGYKNYLMFVVGINTGLRISDILELKVKDLKDKTHIKIIEQKTNKIKRFLINSSLKVEIDKYIKTMSDEEYLFQSRKGQNKPISRVQAYRILNSAAEHIGLQEIGTHTLRKTFGYWHYKQYKDVALLQEIFNHSSPSVTLRYIGINEDIKDKSIENFYL